jgi:hypothetical protein
MGFYAITLGFDLSSVTKVNNASRSVNQNYLTKFAKVSRRVILHNRKINVTMRGTDPFVVPTKPTGTLRSRGFNTAAARGLKNQDAEPDRLAKYIKI